MTLTTTRLFPLALMFALALITFYLEIMVREDPSAPPLQRHDPDYIVTNFTTTTYNRDGVPTSQLSAARMLHFPDERSELLAPRVVQSRPDEPGLTVRAERGVLSGDGAEIFLYDDVVLVREPHAGQPAAKLTTSFLHILRERSLVRTDREVTIVEDGRSLSGRGMEYNSDTRQFRLQANVVARFEPRSAP
ncbi:MAG TPA: LPS export ABC transporter periplasmic protein LptC [Burkholderiales bacterium]|nr:LPS export ABC transporter periplasmic protein LptC [Burkholderiales bacterium]